MPGRVNRATNAKREADYLMRVLDVLANSENSLTLDGIRERDMILTGLSTQKISRLTSKLIEMGMVRKGKSKSTGRMHYMAVAQMKKQGYDVEEEV